LGGHGGNPGGRKGVPGVIIPRVRHGDALPVQVYMLLMGKGLGKNR